MTSEQVFTICNGAIGSAEFGAMGVTVLVVDCDSTCLAIVSKMLYVSGYRVITATHAADAMCILQEREDEVDLILTEIHLPDMDKYELLETVGEISSIPIVILSADNDENAMLGCLFKGAAFYLLKPITMNEIKILWQFSNIKKLKEKVDSEGSTSCEGESPPYSSSYQDSDCISFSNALEQNAQKGKRKEPEESYGDKEVDYDNSTLRKKPKLIWTNELHHKFLQALRTLGIDNAHPKKILKHMNVPGLKKENISSHLQKYRLSLKREQDAIERTMLGDYHMSPFSFHGETIKFLKPQLSMTRNPEFSSYVQNQKNLSWSVPSLDSTNLPIFVESNHNDISMARQNDEVYSTCSGGSNGIKSCSNEDMGIFDPAVRNDNSEEVLKQSSTLSDVENFGFEGIELLGNSSQEHQQFLLPPLSSLMWEQQSDDIFYAEMGDFGQLFDIRTGRNYMFQDSMFQDDDFSSMFDYPF